MQPWITPYRVCPTSIVPDVELCGDVSSPGFMKCDRMTRSPRRTNKNNQMFCCGRTPRPWCRIVSVRIQMVNLCPFGVVYCVMHSFLWKSDFCHASLCFDTTSGYTYSKLTLVTKTRSQLRTSDYRIPLRLYNVGSIKSLLQREFPSYLGKRRWRTIIRRWTNFA